MSKWKVERAIIGIAFLALAAICVPACSDPPPKIGRDLPRTFADARPVFDKRIRELFPIGSDEAALLTELRTERFKIQAETTSPSQYESSAVFTANQLVCSATWAIHWSSAGGKVTAITGDYGATCL